MANGLLMARILRCSDRRWSLSLCKQVYDWHNVHRRGYTRVRPKSVRSAEREVLGPGRNRNLLHKRALGSPPVPHDHRHGNLAGKSTSQTGLGVAASPAQS
jgi:hypothetical protein